MSGDTAPLPAPTRSGGKPLPKPATKPVAQDKPVPEFRTMAKPATETAPPPAEPARPAAPPAPSAANRTSSVRASVNATSTAPLTTLTVPSRAKRPTVTGSLLAKEALLKAL